MLFSLKFYLSVQAHRSEGSLKLFTYNTMYISVQAKAPLICIQAVYKNKQLYTYNNVIIYYNAAIKMFDTPL